MAHEILVDLFKNRPSFGAELLTEALGVEVPQYTEAIIKSIDITQTAKASSARRSLRRCCPRSSVWMTIVRDFTMISCFTL